ncbi:MAG: deoxyribose-phosphate aldolase [Anaerorhabdus sp.]
MENKMIDHTLLKQDSVASQFKNLCDEAKQFNFATVCVNPSWIEFCKKELLNSDVKVCTVIGFPLGQMTKDVKVYEAKSVIALGADEVDMVINIADIKERNINKVIDEIKSIKEAVGSKVLKVIIETCLLSDEEKVIATQAVIDGGADFVKTSTGFSKSGATVHDVEILASVTKGKIQIKAAGGVRTLADLNKMKAAGATRIGTSSGCALMKDEKVTNVSY